MTNKNQRRLIKKKKKSCSTWSALPFQFPLPCLFSFPQSGIHPHVTQRCSTTHTRQNVTVSLQALHTILRKSILPGEREALVVVLPVSPWVALFALQVPHPDASLTGFVSFQYPYILGFWVSRIPFGPVLRTLPIRELAAGLLLSSDVSRVCILAWWVGPRNLRVVLLQMQTTFMDYICFGFSYSSPPSGIIPAFFF